jgi:hypothetical protein
MTSLNISGVNIWCSAAGVLFISDVFSKCIVTVMIHRNIYNCMILFLTGKY